MRCLEVYRTCCVTTREAGRSRLRARDRSAEASRTNRDAGGSRTHKSRFAAGCLAVWLQRRDRWNALARSRTWSPTFAGSCANPSHSEDFDILIHDFIEPDDNTRHHAGRNPPPGNRTRPCGFEDRRAPDTLAGKTRIRPIPPPGVEPGLRLSESRVRFRHTPRAKARLTEGMTNRPDSRGARI